MRTLSVILSLALLFFYTACKKSTTTIPKPTIDTIGKTDTSMPDKGTSGHSTIYPYTDTFYGQVYQGDWSVPDTSNTYAFIYAYHPSADSIRFTSNYFVSGSTTNYKGFGIYHVNDTNYYYTGFFSDDYSYFKINAKSAGDSLYYFNVQPEGGDNFEAYFTGYKVGH